MSTIKIINLTGHFQSDDDDVIIDSEDSTLSERGSDETYILPRTPDSPLINILIGCSPDLSVSWDTVEYIDLLKSQMPKSICPLSVPGDGNCLLHSISVALWGSNKYHANLRELLRTELIQFQDFYRNSVDKSKEDEESQGLTVVEYEKILGDASSARASLGFIHIFALSNILKRPIIVYASNEDIKKWGIHEEGVAGTFLPTRHGASECCAKSIALGWSNGLLNHFVPLCPTEACDDNFNWPRLDIVFKKTLKLETVDHYFSYANLFNERKKFFQIISEAASKKKLDMGPQKIDNNISLSYSWEDDPLETAKSLIGLVPESQIELIAKHLNEKREAMLANKGLKKATPLRRKEPRIHINILPMDFIWTTLPAANNPKLLKKILQFNDEVREKYKSAAVFNTRGKYILGERDIILLESVFNSLQLTKSPTKSSSFDCEALDIVLQLLS